VTNFLEVRPNTDEVENSRLAIWDQDEAHLEADPYFEKFGGAYIAGDKKNPDASYIVADTAYVRKTIKDGRLVLVADKVSARPDISPEARALLRAGGGGNVDTDALANALSPEQAAELIAKLTPKLALASGATTDAQAASIRPTAKTPLSDDEQAARDQADAQAADDAARAADAKAASSKAKTAK